MYGKEIKYVYPIMFGNAMFNSVKHAFLLQDSLEALIYTGNLQKRNPAYTVFYNYVDHANISLDRIHGNSVLDPKQCSPSISKDLLNQEYNWSYSVRTSSCIWEGTGKGRLLSLNPGKTTFSSPLCSTVSFIPLLEITIRLWYNTLWFSWAINILKMFSW